MTSRIYGSPGLLSDDSAVESWESSTQRDVSPNDTPFQNVSSDTDGMNMNLYLQPASSIPIGKINPVF